MDMSIRRVIRIYVRKNIGPAVSAGSIDTKGKRMAFGNKGKSTSVRLTGLFVSKNRRGLAVGTMRASDMPALIEKIKEANGKKLGLTFFLWKNDRQGPAFSISVDVERPREQQSRPAGPSRKPIEADDLFGPEPEAADDPFKD